MLRVAVSMLSLASCLGDSIGNKRLVGQVGLVEKAESRASALAGFQKFADGLVAQYMVDGKELDDTTKDAIRTVITYIDSFYDSSEVEHGVDFNRVANCPDAIESCVRGYLPRDTTKTIQILKDKTDELRDIHEQCRKTQVTCPTVINDACNLYDSARADYDSLPSCVGQGHLGDDYIRADADDLPEPNNLQKMEECLTYFKDWFDPLYMYYKNCKRGTDDCPVPPPANQCDKEQWDFESEHCELTIDVEHACTEYQKCETRENARCAAGGTVCSEVAINVGARKADNETGERIKCLLNVLVNSTDADKPGDLQACVTATYLTDHFNITCPARDVVLTPPYDCQQEREAPPCGTKFVELEYPVSFPNYQEVRCGCRVCQSFLPESQRIDEGCPQVSGGEDEVDVVPNIQALGSTECQNGDTPITTALKCEQAASQLGKTFHGIQSYADYPMGCSHHSKYDDVTWNTKAGRDQRAAPVCYKAEATTLSCTLSKYWCDLFTEARIDAEDQGKITSSKGLWFYDGLSTGVGAGGYDKDCSSKRHVCAGGKTYGYGIKQVEAIKVAIKNGGRHPDVPATKA